MTASKTSPVKSRIRKGDKVVVLTGRDRGKAGEVLRVLPKEGRAIVSGVNLVKRHLRAGPGRPEGGIDTREAAINLSNIAIADPADGKATRVGYKFLDDGRKVRFAKRSGEVIDV